jgi:hypothetical protein
VLDRTGVYLRGIGGKSNRYHVDLVAVPRADPSGALYVRDPEALRIAIPIYFAQTSIDGDESFVPREGAARFDSAGRWGSM